MYVFSTPGHPVLDTNFAIASCLFSMKCPQQSPLPLPNSGKKLFILKEKPEIPFFILKEKPKIPIFDETEYSWEPKHLTRNFFTYPKFSKFSFCSMDFLRSASKYPSPLSIHLIHTFPTDVRSHPHSGQYITSWCPSFWLLIYLQTNGKPASPIQQTLQHCLAMSILAKNNIWWLTMAMRLMIGSPKRPFLHPGTHAVVGWI